MRDLEDIDLAEIIPNVTEEGIELLEREIEELESFVSDLTRIEREPKVSRLVDDIDQLEREGHNRVIIFTQYTDTMDFIRESLISTHGSTVATYSGRGGELYDRDGEAWRTVAKERVKREFAADDGQVDILVCTDSASEGLNLQECGALINYDLPWNPMRVEQRIGRIDRIGQRYDDVTILNYSYKDTVETDIYDRLDDRIGLFETVVGEMQPILSDVSKQIRDATLGADAEDSAQAVEEADRAISARLDEQEEDDRVDVKESLEDVESLLPQDIIDEAKLDAWQSFEHPDIIDVGNTEYEYPAPYRTPSLEAVLVENESLAECGIRFTALSDLDVELAEGEFADAMTYSDATFRVSAEQQGIDLPETEGQDQTIAQAIAPGENSVAVTFSPECADEFPSVEYLAPGNPLLGQLLAILRHDSDEPGRLRRLVVGRNTSFSGPIVGGWGRKDSIGRLTERGDVAEDLTSGVLESWCEAFIENRDQAAPSLE